jgi:hypothetical protein
LGGDRVEADFFHWQAEFQVNETIKEGDSKIKRTVKLQFAVLTLVFKS